MLVIGWIAFFCGIFLSGLLVFLETALYTTIQVPSLSLETKKLREEPRVRALLERAEDSLISCEIMRYLFLALTVISGVGLAREVIPFEALVVYERAGVMLIFCTLIILFVEIFPRSLAVERPEEIVRALTFVYFVLDWLTTGFRHCIRYALQLSARALRLNAAPALHPHETNGTMPGSLELEPGVIEAEEYELIDGILDFHDSTVQDILTHRSEIDSYPIELDREELCRKMREGRFSRVPIYEGTSDQLIGILHLKDLLLFPDRPIRDMLRKPLIVADDLGLFELLREFKRSKIPVALVYDQYGALQGLVTMHDLLEEIVGKMRDDEERAPKILHNRGANGEMLVSGLIGLDQLREELNIDLPDEGVRTLAGFVMHRLERIPAAGDSVTTESWRIMVREMAGRTLTLAEIAPLDAAVAQADGAEERNQSHGS